MLKHRLLALAILVVGALLAYFVFASEPGLYTYGRTGTSTPPFAATVGRFPFKLGLDLSGGTHLVYRADLSEVPAAEAGDALESLRDVIERRVNLFGVAEPIVQIEKGSITGGSGAEQRLVVELPGITDVAEAVRQIGQTPSLMFKTERPEGKEKQDIIKAFQKYQEGLKTGHMEFSPLLSKDPYYLDTPLTGRFIERATLEFDRTTNEPTVAVQFNSEGADLFAKMTKQNIGKTIGIYLDGAPISTPVVREEINGGKAIISGNFTPQEAKQLVGRLNSGALPVPIELISTQVIGAPLGEKALKDGLYAGLIGLLAVALFLIAWYRLPGAIAVLALAVYVAIILVIFKLIPVTLTAAGIAGFILSVGMAVDANILIAERTKEELRRGKGIRESIALGFARAWTSIRDSNISSILTGIILFWFGTSLIEGFALTFVLGVIVSMFSAITVTRTFLYALGIERRDAFTSFLFSSGLNK
ncbi:protein translocase subunit SecD [Candidatus Parcubacteria bacterium]|nr:protein translocase subunit SecD [Candidatus Parcubacteria bacterium]